jgi:hypothetical protein
VARGDRDDVPSGLAALAFVGGLVAMAGTYWDDSWHTDRGRDDFFIPPHLTLYGGVLVAALAVGVWASRAVRSPGVVDGLRSNRPLRWAVAGAVAVFVSAPIDDAWHRAYGRDAVLFSPPHLLAIVASIVLVVALATGLRPGAGPLSARERAVRVLGGAGVLGALVVPVMEYEADVPQFSVAWFLPLVTGAVVVARPVATRLLGGRWPLTQAAAAYMAIRLLLVVGLAVGGFSTPIVPPVVVAALVADIGAHRRWPWAVQGAAVTLAVHAAYVPWLAVVPHGAKVTGDELVLSLVVAFAAAFAAQVATGSTGRVRAPAVAASGVLVLVVVLVGVARPAAAHDPGQGERRGDAEMTVTVAQRTVRLQVTLTGVDCDALRGSAVVARRAGMTRIEAMPRIRPCTYEGYTEVPTGGRWFIYATFDAPDAMWEAWLPVEAADGTRSSETRVLYQPASGSEDGSQLIVGAALVVVAALLLLGCVRMVAAPEDPVAGRDLAPTRPSTT